MPPNTTAATANSSNPNSTASAPGSGSNSGGGGGGVVPDFPSGWDLLTSALDGAITDFLGGVAGVIDAFHGRVLTLPAPGEPMNPATWATPSDPYWIATGTVYAMLMALSLIGIWAVGWFNVGIPRGVPRRRRLRTLVVATLAVGFGFSVILPAWFHFWNEAALAFAPSGEEFLSTPGNTARFGLGVLLGVGLAFAHGSILLAGLGIHLLFIMLTYIFVALWPLSVALRASESFAVETIGYSGILATLALGPLQFAKAVVLRLIFEAPMSPSDPSTLFTALMIIVGLAIAFLLLPWEGLKRLIPRSIVASGGRVGTRTGESAKERMADLRERVPSGAALRERVHTASSGASRLGGRAGGDDTRTRTQTPSALSSRGGAAGSNTNTSPDTRARTSSLQDRLNDRSARTDGHADD
jgi:hypothetical protein